MWENYAFSANIVNACSSKNECVLLLLLFFHLFFQLFFYCFGSRSAMCRSERNKIFGTLASGHNSEIQYKSPRQYCIIKRNLCRHSNFSHHNACWFLGGLSFSNIYLSSSIGASKYLFFRCDKNVDGEKQRNCLCSNPGKLHFYERHLMGIKACLTPLAMYLLLTNLLDFIHSALKVLSFFMASYRRKKLIRFSCAV